MHTTVVKEVEAYVREHREEILAKYEELVNLKDFWRDARAVDDVGEWLKKEFTNAGFDCSLVSFTPEAGNALVGTLGADRPGKPILFSGHMDTALASELYAEQPFRIEKGKAYGPGVVDMKGGLIIALYVAKALNAVGYDERPLKILFVPDEEGSHQFTNVAGYLTEEAAGCFFAFNMETGLMDNSLTVGRKGGIGIDVEVTGKAAHAGQAFFEGVNAIEEMAHKIVAFQALTDAEKGTTVNTGVIKGGTVPNAVPGVCTCELDVRFTTLDELERVRQAIEVICATSHVTGATCSYREQHLFPPFVTGEKEMKLFHFLEKTAETYGYARTQPAQVGGCSDAAFIQKAGIPVLCSCGIRGDRHHTTDEFAVVDSLFERIQWLTAAVIDAGELAE